MTIPWIYSGPGWGVDHDTDIADGTDVGSVWSEIDVGCDGTVDYMHNDCLAHDTPELV